MTFDKEWKIVMAAKVEKDRVTITMVPEAYAAWTRVGDFSPNAIKLGDWPEWVYGGRWIRGIDDKLKI